MITESKHYIANAPGETIKELLETQRMTQKEFAHRMGFSEKHVSKLINGEVHLTINVAKKLEFVLGVQSYFWIKCEALYRETLQKVEEENEMEKELKIFKDIPYESIEKRGYVSKTNSNIEAVYQLRRFFQVANLAYIPGLEEGCDIENLVNSQINRIELMKSN